MDRDERTSFLEHAGVMTMSCGQKNDLTQRGKPHTRQTGWGVIRTEGILLHTTAGVFEWCGPQFLIAVSRFHNPGPDDYDGGGSNNKFRPSERNVIAKHPDRRHARLHIVAQGRQAKNKRHRQ